MGFLALSSFASPLRPRVFLLSSRARLRFFAIKFPHSIPSSPQTTKLSAGRDALGLLPHASALNSHRTGAALERTRSPKLIPHGCHNPADGKSRRRNRSDFTFPGNEKNVLRVPFHDPPILSRLAQMCSCPLSNFHSSIYNLPTNFFFDLLHHGG